MSANEITEVIDAFRRICNDLKVDEPSTLDLFTDDITYTDPRFPAFRGKAELKDYFQRLAGENKGIGAVWEYTNVIAGGEQACAEWEVRSTADLGGQTIQIFGATVFRVREGKICYYRGYWDTGSLTGAGEQA